MGKTIQLESGKYVKICSICNKDFTTINKFAKNLCDHCGKQTEGLTPIIGNNHKNKPPIGMKPVKIKCDACGVEFNRSAYHPTVTKCDACKKLASKNTKKTAQTLARGFNVLNDEANQGMRMPINSVDRIQEALDKNLFAIVIEGLGTIRLFKKHQTVGIGYGAYKIVDGKLVLYKNYLKSFGRTGKHIGV